MFDLFKRWRQRRRAEDDDAAEELASHLAIEAAGQKERGITAKEASSAARRDLGNLTGLREQIYEQWRWTPLETFAADFRFGLRLLRKTPVWSTIVVTTLIFGIALTTAAFSLFYSLLLQPLPYPEGDRLVTIWTAAPKSGYPRMNATPANWRDWQEQNRSFTGIGIVKPSMNYNLTGVGEPERVRGAKISANLLPVLGVRPFLGRIFTAGEVDRDAPVAIVGHGLWRRRFGSDPKIVGSKIGLNNRPTEVIGIMPDGFAFPTREFELWTPAYIEPETFRARMDADYQAIARLKPEWTLARAQSEMSAIMRRIASDNADQLAWLGPQDIALEPLLTTTVTEARRPLTILMAAVFGLLAVACLNTGVLLSLRAGSREREIALRSALGAQPSRLAYQLFGEIVPLALAAAVGGTLASVVLLRVATAYLPVNFPRTEAIGVHWPVLFFALGLSITVLLAVGLLPALNAFRRNENEALMQSSRSVAGGAGTRRALVVAQLAMSTVLLLGDGLLLHSLANLLRVHPGFATEHALTMHMIVSRVKYSGDAEAAAYLERVVRRVDEIPGVLAAGIANRLPFAGTAQTGPIEFEDRLELGPIDTDWRSATPGYFRSIGIPLRRGRLLSASDRGNTLRCGLIDDQLAARVFGRADATGHRFRMAAGKFHGPWTTVVGVVGHIRNDGPGSDARPQMYLPETQRMQDRAALVVRTVGDPAKFLGAVKEAIRKENSDQAVYDVRSMRQWLDYNLETRTLMATLLAGFGVAALALACLGLYAVVADRARQRTREFGIRIALGATGARVASTVLGEAGVLVLAGLVTGLLLSTVLLRLITSLLFGITPNDQVTLLSVPVFLAAAAFVAALVPALRAAKTDPAESLRAE